MFGILYQNGSKRIFDYIELRRNRQEVSFIYFYILVKSICSLKKITSGINPWICRIRGKK